MESLDDEDDGEDSDESPGDREKLETMRVSHPIYFAKKLADVSHLTWKIQLNFFIIS